MNVTKWWVNGTDSLLYVDGRLLPEAVQLAYNLQRQQLPIYGYNHTLFDRVSRGQEIVVGAIDLTHSLSRPEFVAWLAAGAKTPASNLAAFNQSDADAVASGIPNSETILKLKNAFWGELAGIDVQQTGSDSIESHKIELRLYDGSGKRDGAGRAPTQTILIRDAYFGGLGSQDSVYSSSPKTWNAQFIARTLDA